MTLTEEGLRRICDRHLKSQYDSLMELIRSYSSDDDPLHVFRVSAELQGTIPRDALGGMMSEHIVRLFDMIRCPDEIPMEQWDTVIVKIINHLILLKAMMAERIMDEIQSATTTSLPPTTQFFIPTPSSVLDKNPHFHTNEGQPADA